MTWGPADTEIYAATHDVPMIFELPDGTTTELDKAGGDFTIVSSSGITCPL